MVTLYEILGHKGKNSILKSVFIKSFNDSHANIRIEIEPYDDTFLNAYYKKGEDYIWKQLEKQLCKEDVRWKIADHIGVNVFNGALVTIYGDNHSEMYFMPNGKNQYGIKW